jgi:hypothetical protein
LINNGKYTGKLLVTSSGTGSTGEITAQVQTRSYSYFNDPPSMLRSATTPSYYLNVIIGVGVVPFDVSLLGDFYFTTTTTLTVETTQGLMELAGYSGSNFSYEPTQTDSGWDWNKSLRFGGAAYGSFFLDRTAEYVSVVHKKGIIIWDCQKEQETKIPMENIAANIWTDFPNGKISAFTFDSGIIIGMSYIVVKNGASVVYINEFETGELAAATLCSNFPHNNNTNVIPATVRVNANGTLTVSYTNHLGIAKEKDFVW